MKEYKQALEYILANGRDKSDRTGVGTRSVFGYQMRFDLQKGFPATTTKKLAWKAVVSELLWFLEGSGDERRLAEILHGTRDLNKKTIWTANAEADYWLKQKAKLGSKLSDFTVSSKAKLVEGEHREILTTPDYDLGRVYGVQWRHWRRPIEMTSYSTWENTSGGMEQIPNPDYHVDQITNLIEGIKRDPSSRRHIVSAWNPGELEQMALPPCHVMSQFDVTDGQLSCQMYQRSCDMFLGVPFNIASYSLLTHIIARECDLAVGDFVWVGGDCHIYNNHFDAVREQLTREERALPVLKFETKPINEYNVDDFVLEGYDPHPPIKAEMAV
jgi:thymidylate synthase